MQKETFHQYHPDWQHRAKAPYVIFDETASHCNMHDPHCVAAWEKGAGIPEKSAGRAPQNSWTRGYQPMERKHSPGHDGRGLLTSED